MQSHLVVIMALNIQLDIDINFTLLLACVTDHILVFAIICILKSQVIDNLSCDQICQKGFYTHTILRYTFHYYLIATLMDEKKSTCI